MNNVHVAKKDNKIVFWSDDFNAISKLTKLLSYEGRADTVVRVNNNIYKIKKLKDKIITVQIEGEFEPLSQSKSFQKEGDRSEI